MSEKASSLLSQLNSAFEEREQELEKAQADLKQQLEAFESEKELMQTKTVTDSDVINLNVGGTILSTFRSTLTQAEGSVLAAMFSGRWEQCLKLDPEGRVFLEFDPYCFQEILSHLRCCTIRSSTTADVPLPSISPCKQAAYKQLVKYLALEDYMGYSVAPSLRFSQAASGAHISSDGQHVSGYGSNPAACRSVIVEPAISNVSYAKFKIHKAGWLFLGIGANINIAGSANYSAADTYGWSCNQASWTQGRHESARWTQGKHESASFIWQQSDWVLIKADMDSGMLSMVASEVPQPLFVPLSTSPDKQYAFHTILRSNMAAVELLTMTPEDWQLLQ